MKRETVCYKMMPQLKKKAPVLQNSGIGVGKKARTGKLPFHNTYQNYYSRTWVFIGVKTHRWMVESKLEIWC